MPIGQTNTVQLGEDSQGTLRADAKIDPSFRNVITQAPASGLPGYGNPGMYAFQMRPAGAQQYSIPASNGGVTAAPSGLLALPGGGAAATYTTIPFQKDLFDHDGVDDLQPEINDPAAGMMNIWTPGYWRAGIHVHLGDPSGSNASFGPNSLWQVAVQARTASITAGSFSSIGSYCQLATSFPTTSPAFGKWPFFFGTNMHCSGLWSLDRGDAILFAARAFTGTVYQAAPGGSDSLPWVYTAWAYLAKPY